MILEVLKIEQAPIGPETMWTFIGRTNDANPAVYYRFGADHRPGLDIALALSDNDLVEAEVPDYMIVGQVDPKVVVT